MQLRASELLGTDLVALAIWPDDHDPSVGGGVGDTGGEMPVEVRCVDVALAAALEGLVERAGPGGGTERAEGRQERAARGLLRWLVARAQRHQQD